MRRVVVRFLWLLGGLAGLAVAGWLIVWLLLVGGQEPFVHRLAAWPVFPVACSTRGCISTAQWQRQQETQARFAAATGSEAPTPAQSLTTVVRQHLVRHASVRIPATLADARRYREDVLQARDSAAIEQATGMTSAEYDRLAVLPLLQQEAVRLERDIATYDALFEALANERSIVILAWRYRWDGDTGSVQEN